MVDMSEHVQGKAEQLNADDLRDGPRIFTIEGVRDMKRERGDEDQPIWIKLREWPLPWKPCLTVRRQLKLMWGKKGSDYGGRRVELYRDPDVKFGGDTRGGIRIRNASHLKKPWSDTLPAAKGRVRRFTIGVLGDDPPATGTAEGGGGQRSQPPPPPFGRDGMGKLISNVERPDQLTDGDRRALFQEVMRGLTDEGMERADRLNRFVKDERGVCMDAGIPPAGMQKLAEIAEGLK